MDEVKLFTVFTLSSATADNIINAMKNKDDIRENRGRHEQPKEGNQQS